MSLSYINQNHLPLLKQNTLSMTLPLLESSIQGSQPAVQFSIGFCMKHDLKAPTVSTEIMDPQVWVLTTSEPDDPE